MKTYDYIIAGAGCAGLSLAYRISKSNSLTNKKVLILDKEQKSTNDKTWSFWEKEIGLFEQVVCKAWDFLLYKDDDFLSKMDVAPYRYKMIKAIDFYNFVKNTIENSSQFHFSTENILEMDVQNNKAILKTDINEYQADCIFDSTSLFLPKMPKENTLIQHFMGWSIKSDKEIFDPKVATLMDFSVPQDFGTTFFYVLPTSTTDALVEFTLFTESVLEKHEYEKNLKNYIQNNLGIEHYQILHNEYGEIPMTKSKFPKYTKNRIIHLGTAGGYTKASSGYTFQFIQKHCDKILEFLEADKPPIVENSFFENRFSWYDKTMLEVLLTKGIEGKEMFGRIFRNSTPETIFSFLSNESNLLQEISIMKSLPVLPFAKAGIKELFL